MSHTAVAGILEDQRGGIRELLVVIEGILSPQAHDPGGQCVDAEAPACLVEFVGSIVADVAAAEGVPPPPCVMKAVFLEGHQRCGADPEVIVDARRGGTGLHVADVFPSLHVPRLRHQHVADRSLAEQLHGVGDQRVGPALCAVLHDCLAAVGRVEQQPRLVKVVAARLLHINMLAGVAGEDRCRRMPVIRSGDNDRVDPLIIEDPSQVGLGRVGGKRLASLGQSALVGIADGRQPHA